MKNPCYFFITRIFRSATFQMGGPRWDVITQRINKQTSQSSDTVCAVFWDLGNGTYISEDGLFAL
jgi:hypothetical protein